MGDQAKPMETRRRSRSKTPSTLMQLRSTCDHENCEFAGDEDHIHHHKKKTMTGIQPKVTTIIEESEEVISSSTPIRKTIASDILNLPVTLTSKQTQSASSFTTSTTSTTIVTKNKIIGNSQISAATTSTPISKQMQESYLAQFSDSGIDARRIDEVAQNNINIQLEQSSQDVISKNNSKDSSRNLSYSGLFDSSVEIDKSKHLPYQDYKRHGEYWRVTPKTDYTYSELSPHRRVLAPGVIAMPNMSRPSLEHYSSRLLQNYKSSEQHVTKRYMSSRTTQRDNLMYDSAGEDEIDLTRVHSTTTTERYFITQLITIIWRKIFGGGGASSALRTRVSLWRRTWNAFGSIISGLIHAFYYMLIYISYLDNRILQTSHMESKGRKRFFLLLLLLLPFLLFGGIYYKLHPNDSFPPNLSSLSFPELSMPDMPKIDMSKYINEDNYEIIKTQALDRYQDLRDWTDDYLSYLKTLSQNIIDEGRKFFQHDEYYERA